MFASDQQLKVSLLIHFRRKESMKLATLKNLFREESGQDLIEYALVAALIALGCITAMKGLASGISTAFSTISSDLSSAVA